MSKVQSPAAFAPEVPGLAYFVPEAFKAEAVKPAAAPALAAGRSLAVLAQMFDYFD